MEVEAEAQHAAPDEEEAVSPDRLRCATILELSVAGRAHLCRERRVELGAGRSGRK